LGREVRWTDSGLEWRGSEKLVKEMLEDFELKDAKAVETPGQKEEVDIDEEYMTTADGARFRSAAAKLNYLSLDNPRIAYASKEVSRTMSNPRVEDEPKLKRILRYLKGRPTTTLHYHWQDTPTELVGYSDSDWAGCVRTRRSTSGGVVLHGAHLLHFWSRTQSCVALSSGEAELNSTLKLGCEIVGIGQCCEEIGLGRSLRMRGDSSAVKGLLGRRGAGKIKRLEVKQQWLQDQCRSGKILFEKVPRSRNPSDALTHHYTSAEASVHFGALSIAS